MPGSVKTKKNPPNGPRRLGVERLSSPAMPTSPDGPIAALHRAIARLQDGGGSRPPARVEAERVHPPEEPLAEADVDLVEVDADLVEIADADMDMTHPAPD